MPPNNSDSNLLHDLQELVHRYNIDSSFRLAIETRIDQGNYYWNRRPLKLYLGLIHRINAARYKPQVESLATNLAQGTAKSEDIKQNMKRLFNSFEYENKGQDWQTLQNQIDNPNPRFQEIQSKEIQINQLPEQAQAAARNQHANSLLGSTPQPSTNYYGPAPSTPQSTTPQSLAAPSSNPAEAQPLKPSKDSNLSLGLAIDRAGSPDEIKGLIERVNQAGLTEMQKLNLLASAEYRQDRLLKLQAKAPLVVASAPNVVKLPAAAETAASAAVRAGRLGKSRLPRYLQNSLSAMQVFFKRKFSTGMLASGALLGIGGMIIGGPEAAALGAITGAAASAVISKGELRTMFRGSSSGGSEMIATEEPVSSNSGSGRFHLPGRGLFARVARKGATKAAKKGLMAALLPEEGVAAIILLVILIIVGGFILFIMVDKNDKDNPLLMFSTGGTSSTSNNTAVIITKSGPASVNNKQDINYKLDVTYTGAGSADIEVTDQLPQNSTAKNISDNGALQGQGITWELKSLSSGQSHQLTFTLTPDPNKSDFWVVNYAEATIKNQTTTSDDPAFDQLMTGQGRNTNVLGDESRFVSTLVQRGSSVGHDFTSYQDQFKEIYEKSVADNINPLILVSIWNVEVGFNKNGVEFSCPPTGFSNELDCAVGTLNDWMNFFDKNQKGGTFSFIAADGHTCTYTDPFIYAYEKYTPICYKPINESARGNFVSTYTKLLGK